MIQGGHVVFFLAGRQLMSTKVKMEDAGEHLHYLNKSLDVTRTDLKSIQLQKRLKVNKIQKNEFLRETLGYVIHRLQSSLAEKIGCCLLQKLYKSPIILLIEFFGTILKNGNKGRSIMYFFSCLIFRNIQLWFAKIHVFKEEYSDYIFFCFGKRG